MMDTSLQRLKMILEDARRPGVDRSRALLNIAWACEEERFADARLRRMFADSFEDHVKRSIGDDR